MYSIWAFYTFYYTSYTFISFLKNQYKKYRIKFKKKVLSKHIGYWINMNVKILRILEILGIFVLQYAFFQVWLLTRTCLLGKWQITFARSAFMWDRYFQYPVSGTNSILFHANVGTELYGPLQTSSLQVERWLMFMLAWICLFIFMDMWVHRVRQVNLSDNRIGRFFLCYRKIDVNKMCINIISAICVYDWSLHLNT